MHYVYVLKSQKYSTLYTGRTNNLKQRYANHQAGLVKSTKHKRPLKLIFYESFLRVIKMRFVESATSKQQKVKVH